ncbi:MAG: FAD-dependent oxidoreductase [Rhodospirillaceae bacterium]|nr:FAD-dependent oxidoreductase [Rhodospirillaceae bacterium]
MNRTITADICVIGAGSGGLSVAAGAQQMGANVVLIEKNKMGGDCLNSGCVPSKALLAAAHSAKNAKSASAFGVDTDVSVNGEKVFAHVQNVIKQIEPHDSQQRFEKLGVKVIRDNARFISPAEVSAGENTIKARRFVIATGSRPFIPPISGIENVNVLTNENIFELRIIPEHLIIIGGGPIGVEMAQAFCNLGAKVSLIEMATICPKDDPEMVGVLRRSLIADGVEIFEGAKISGVINENNNPVVLLTDNNGKEIKIGGSHLLVAAGRRPNVEDMGLDVAGVATRTNAPGGIIVDGHLKTTNKKIYAIGDVIGTHQFTHVAGYHAGIVIKNVLFKLPAKTNLNHVPWVTYTDPELAHAGLNEADALKKSGQKIKILKSDFTDNDRARAENKTFGKIKVVTTNSGKILGVTIIGPAAGELITPWVLAMEKGLKISALAGTIIPYPTLSEISKHAAGSFYTPKLYGRGVRWLVKLLARLG